MCNTVAFAHDQGIVHRDLKPSNIMLGPYGETLVMDWGLAKRFGEDETAPEAVAAELSRGPSADELTATGAVMGTPQYMSPEQARGEPAGPASDIFNLGLILYAILTGKPAFEETTLRAVDPLKVVREAAIVSPRKRNPDLSPALDAVCAKALAARPKKRYPSARDVAKDVENWLADEPVAAWREPLSMRLRRWMRRNRTLVTAAAAALMGVTLVSLFYADQRARTATTIGKLAERLQGESENLRTERANLTSGAGPVQQSPGHAQF